MHMHFEQTTLTQTDCAILSLTWMGKVPEEEADADGWRLNRSNYYEDGWLATGNVRGIVAVTFTTSHGRKIIDLPQRANYNLRGHREKVVLVKWNEPYQKLASCDSTGVIFVWIKYEGRWSIELINDRNNQVTDFAWSHDGRMALICYDDGFVLVGSVSGQRYWSSTLNVGSTINCGIWSPDDQQVMFGTAKGSVIVIDVQGNIIAQLTILDSVPITSMAWSSEKFNMEEVEDDEYDTVLKEEGKTFGSSVKKCSGSHFRKVHVDSGDSVLSVCFQNGLVYMMKSYDDVSPTIIDTELKGVKMEWSNSGDILAVAGYKADSPEGIYLNCVQFYQESGDMCFMTTLPWTQSSVTALTWGHNDMRLFICTGNHIFIGWITKKMASLQLLSRIALYQCLKDESSVSKLQLPLCLQTLVCNLFGPTIKCYLPDPDSLRDFVSAPPPHNIRLYCTMMRHEDDLANNSMTYTLFLEYLGGLVPILKGKRASKLRPEFIIYDPHHPDEDMRRLNAFQIDTHKLSSYLPPTHLAPPVKVSVSSSDSDVDEGCASPRLQRRRRKKQYNLPRGGDWSIIAEREMFTDQLPEQEKIVAISSNIWGTKFKILGLVPWLPSVLGTITYRTSLLHLQPRQMTLVIKELQGPQISQENTTPSTSTTSTNFFSEDEDDLNDPESQLYEESAPIAPMTPRKQTAGIHQMYPVKASFTDDETDHLLDYDLGEYVKFIPSTDFLNPFSQKKNYFDDDSFHMDGTEGHIVSVATQTTLSSTTGHQIHVDIPQITETYHNSMNDSLLIDIDGSDGHHENINAVSENQLRLPSCSSSGASSSPLGGSGQPESSFLSVTQTDHDASSPGSYSVFSASLSVSSCSTDSELNKSGDLCIVVKDKLETGSIKCEKESPHLKTTLSLTAEADNQPNDVLFSSNMLDNHSVDKNIISPCVFYNFDENPQVTSMSSSNLKISPSNNKSFAFTELPISNVPNNWSYQLYWKKQAEDMKFIDEDSEEMNEDNVINNSNPSSSSFIALNHNKQSHNTLLTLLRNRQHSSTFKDRERRVTLKAGKTVPEIVHCTECHGDEMMHEQLSSNVLEHVYRGPEAANSICGCELTNLSSQAEFPRDEWFQAKEVSSKTGNISKSSGAVSDSRDFSHFEDNNNLSVGIPSRLTEHRASVPHTDSFCAGIALSGSRSIPSSPETRRRGNTKQNFLYSPLFFRKVWRQKHNESSDEESGFSTEDIHSEDFRDLESFQKAYIKRKLRKWRGRTVADGPQSECKTVNYREFVLHNKAPLWNEVSQVYQLDFGGRVTQESAKNFQIEFRGKQVMQFGRIDGNAYSLDFQYPFSALQAFAVALANVTQRLK